MASEYPYKSKKVIPIGTVSELTGLTPRQIRYYEDRSLIYPERSEKGTRKYSFLDVETLVEIADHREEGVQTNEIRREMVKATRKANKEDIRKSMLRGQLNAHFRIRK
ncbi:MerR family transcriptional regulator [Tuberibacillus sp. Marseille-P3662]|uniref:MerR family transcriptional regulator n=1 Tax=Tuberibacillus sp. Marseille-P3662 TaxID=1965358 RepID=UPI000A1CA243|nr:MerR family transcriptional regulator [Tuberibacillus sp. Marseille-P3662]